VTSPASFLADPPQVRIRRPARASLLPVRASCPLLLHLKDLPPDLEIPGAGPLRLPDYSARLPVPRQIRARVSKCTPGPHLPGDKSPSSSPRNITSQCSPVEVQRCLFEVPLATPIEGANQFPPVNRPG